MHLRKHFLFSEPSDERSTQEKETSASATGKGLCNTEDFQRNRNLKWWCHKIHYIKYYFLVSFYHCDII